MAPAEFGLENTNSWWQRFSKININYDINDIQSHILENKVCTTHSNDVGVPRLVE
jgi:hypothetical protein